MSAFHFNFRSYLPEEAAERLRAYQYHGADKSLIYKYMWKPLCSSAVNHLPMWLAPNVITVTALVLVCLTHILIWWYMPNLQIDDDSPTADVPGWIFVLTGIALFLYQFLDNMDGHQARRTGSSSPLGLLMDHGCDAFNAVVGSLSVAAAVQAGPTWKSWTALMCAVIIFFLNTWEEYYRGALVLPIINGANEGIMIAISIYFMTAYFGPQFWVDNSVSVPLASLPVWMHRDAVGAALAAADAGFASVTNISVFSPQMRSRVLLHIFGADAAPTHVELKYNTIAIMFMVASSVVTGLGNMYQVWYCVNGGNAERHGMYEDRWLLKRFPFIHALTRLFPLLVVTLIANTWFFISPDNIFVKHPRIFCWTIGLLYTKLVIHLMIAHLCSVEFHPFRRTLVPVFYLGAHVAISYFAFRRGVIMESVSSGKTIVVDELLAAPTDAATSGSFFDEEMILFEFFGLSAVTFAHLAINAIVETATVLDVNIFTIKKKKAANPATAASPAQSPKSEKKKSK